MIHTSNGVSSSILLFEYSNFYNQKLVELLKQHSGAVSEKSIQLINHIINAHQIWNSRILDETPFDVWIIHDFSDLQEIDVQNFQKSIRILEAKDFSEKIKYTNSKGELYTNSVMDILFHLVNHSTYHRAQIATECKSAGITPLVTDYIFFKREKAVSETQFPEPPL